MSFDEQRARSSARVAALAIWSGPVDPFPLAGGITNQNFTVEDRGRRYVVRVGNDILVHGVVRANELAASRAAHLAGLSPGVVHAEPGILVLEFIEGRTFTPEDVRNPANLERLVDMVRRCHRDVPQYLRGPAAMFWVFHVVRDYGHTLREGNSRHVALLPDLLARAARLEQAVGPIEVVFGHNDLLAANFIDDGQRLWLVDWEYGGFNSPLFDLGGLASNSEFSPEQAEQALGLYFDRPVDDAIAPPCRRHDRGLAATRDHVEHGVRDPLERRFRLHRLHGREFAAVRGRLCDLSDDGAHMSELPSSAKIVVVGGGIVGCSVAYHLGKMGLTDVLLLEQGKLTSGSTWHAAGLVGQLRTSANITQLLGYSVQLYDRLEQETGLATGWKRNGGLRLACNPERWTEVKRQATTATSFGLEMHLLTPKEAQDLWPLMQIDDVVGAAFLPTDGQASPSDIAMSLAKGARNAGVKIIEGVRVTGVEVEGGRLRAVTTDQGRVTCDKLVICAGQWSRELGRMAGVNIPLVSVQHQYLITEKIDGVSSNLPTLRDPDRLTYWKEEVGGLVMGGYEPNPKPWAESGLPSHFEFQLLDDDLDHFEPLLELAIGRVPAMQTAGIKQFINGPESFTPDGNFILGEAPELRGVFVGTGFNAFGIAAAGGAGMVLAEWVAKGEPPYDLWPVDIRRFGRNHLDTSWVRTRTLEAYAKHYTMAWPFEEYRSGRPLRRSPLYDRLKTQGACFGEKLGWERPNWFADLARGEKAEDRYSYERQNWFDAVGREHAACRERVAMFDQTSFAKFILVGRDAEAGFVVDLRQRHRQAARSSHLHADAE